MDNPRAFPGQPRDSHDVPCDEYNPGMTLRDYFAGQALAGLVYHQADFELTPANWAHDAYQLADAMLAEREKSHDRS